MNVAAIRAQVVEELALLSEPSRQLAYEHSLRNHAGVAHSELIVGFPSLFAPKAPEFVAAFSEFQLYQLPHLDGLFMEVGNEFSSVTEVLQSPIWRRVVQLSQEIRRSLEHGAQQIAGADA